MPRHVSLIVAAAENGVIGSHGQMPWKLKDDLKFFSRTTSGHVVVMGRTTFESMDGALPNRKNFVLSRSADLTFDGAVGVNSFDSAFKQINSNEELFIIGGANIYNQALDQNLVNRIYLTRIHAKPEGDTFFEFNQKDWRVLHEDRRSADENNQYPFTFFTLEKSD